MYLHQIKDSFFEDLQSGTQGSGFSISRLSCDLTVLRSVFVNCRTTTRDGGGGFYANVRAINVSYCSFSRCHAPDRGCAFLVSSNCKEFSLDCSILKNEVVSEQDCYIRYGSTKDEFCYSNLTQIFCVDNMLTSWPESKITSYYRYVNVQNNKGTGQGLFNTYSNITIESTNIINCSCPSFLRFAAPSKSLFSFVKSVVTVDCSFRSLVYLNAPSTYIVFNKYGSSDLLNLFGEYSGETELNPSLYDVNIGCHGGKSNFEKDPEKQRKNFMIAILFAIKPSSLIYDDDLFLKHRQNNSICHYQKKSSRFEVIT